MPATQSVAVTGTTKPNTTSSSPSEEVLVKDVTAEILGERREEWRAGFDAGLRDGARRVMQSDAMAQLAFELVLLREVAKRLGEKADYWAARSQEMELEATYWHEVASGTQA